MSKDLKEKFERVCTLKDRAISLVDSQINGNIADVDAKELGEVADIAKDMAEIMKLCSEAEYYHKITEAMDKNSDEDNRYFMEKYAPETRYYNGGSGMNSGGSNGGNYVRGRRMYHDDMMPTYYDADNMRMRDMVQGRMYYNSTNQERDMREGRAGISRRMYMEMKETGADKNEKQKELEHYMHELTDDIMEMLKEADPSEKAIMKQKLSTLVSKIS